LIFVTDAEAESITIGRLRSPADIRRQSWRKLAPVIGPTGAFS